MWVLSEKEIQSVTAADTRHRYEYFVHRVCDTKVVWALHDGSEWASLGDDAGQKLMPFWPHQAYANAFVTGDWADFRPTKITLDEFLAQWLPGLRQVGVEPAVFPVPTGIPVVVPIDDLEADLRSELAEYYGNPE